MPTLITAGELSLVLDETISTERFDALYALGLKIVRSGYPGDPEEALPHAAGIITGVLVGVMARIIANPKGARQLMAAGAGLTFGGRDADVASIFTLNPEEREALTEAAALTPRSGAFTIRPGRS